MKKLFLILMMIGASFFAVRADLTELFQRAGTALSDIETTEAGKTADELQKIYAGFKKAFTKARKYPEDTGVNVQIQNKRPVPISVMLASGNEWVPGRFLLKPKTYKQFEDIDVENQPTYVYIWEGDTVKGEWPDLSEAYKIEPGGDTYKTLYLTYGPKKELRPETGTGGKTFGKYLFDKTATGLSMEHNIPDKSTIQKIPTYDVVKVIELFGMVEKAVSEGTESKDTRPELSEEATSEGSALDGAVSEDYERAAEGAQGVAAA